MDRQKASRPVAEFSAYEPRGNDQLAGQIDFQATTKEYIPQPGDCYLMQPCGRSRKPFCEFEIFERPGEGSLFPLSRVRLLAAGGFETQAHAGVAMITSIDPSLVQLEPCGRFRRPCCVVDLNEERTWFTCPDCGCSGIFRGSDFEMFGPLHD